MIEYLVTIHWNTNIIELSVLNSSIIPLLFYWINSYHSYIPWFIFIQATPPCSLMTSFRVYVSKHFPLFLLCLLHIGEKYVQNKWLWWLQSDSWIILFLFIVNVIYSFHSLKHLLRAEFIPYLLLHLSTEFIQIVPTCSIEFVVILVEHYRMDAFVQRAKEKLFHLWHPICAKKLIYIHKQNKMDVSKLRITTTWVSMRLTGYVIWNDVNCEDAINNR